MKQLICEMCGGTDLVKQDGMFVCQTCGTKYSTKEAKKMMVEGKVDVSGSKISIDESEKIAKWNKIMEDSFIEEDYKNALNYANKIMECKDDKIVEIVAECCRREIRGDRDGGGIDDFFDCILKLDGFNKKDYDNHKTLINELADVSKGYDFFKSHMKNIIDYKDLFILLYKKLDEELVSLVEEYKDHHNEISCTFKSLSKYYNEDYNEYLWFKEKLENEKIEGVKFDTTYESIFNDMLALAKEYNEESLNQKTTNKKGCYIATCVYGSYDCPQVWVLRRYRDTILKSTWYGRLFILVYYTISPSIVKCFGHVDTFRSIFKYKLDRMVNKLKQQGFEDTKYYD